MAASIPLAFQVAASVFVGSAGLSGTIAASLIYGGATILGGMVTRKVFGGGDLDVGSQASLRANTISTGTPIPIVYGERLIGSNDLFIEMGGRNTTEDKDYLWIVSALCEGEVDSIAQDEDGDLLFINGERVNTYPDGVIDYWFYRGSPTQTNNPEISAGTGKFDDNMRNTSYLVYRIKYKRDLFVGIPTREIILKGKRVLDIRDGQTKWSRNPALFLYDYLTNSRYGLGWPQSSLDTPSWQEVANYCEPSPQDYRWPSDYIIQGKLNSQTIIETLLAHFRGALHWYDGKLSIKYIDISVGEPVVFNIQDSHIARDSNGSAAVSISHPDKFAMPDGVVVGYINKRDNWTVDKIVVGEREGQIKEIDFAGYTDRDKAIEMGTYTLERQRLARTYSFTLRPDTIVLDPNDLVTITSKELQLSGTLARVKSSSVSYDGSCSVVAILDGESLYNKTFDPDTSEIYEVDLPSIVTAPPSVKNISVAEEVYSYRGRSFVRLFVSFEPPDYPWFRHAEVYVGYPDPDTGEPPSLGDYKWLLSAATVFQVDPVEELQTYYFKFNSVSTYDVRQPDEEAYIFTYRVIGASSEYPPCPTYLSVTVNMASVEIFSNTVESPDIKGYEIRLGNGWDTSIFLTRQSSPAISFTSVRPGEHTFWLNTVHYNGNYCLSPLSETVTVDDPPPNSHMYFEKIIDFTDGQHDNTEAIGTTGLRCSHSGGNLSGTFLSNPIELIGAPPDEISLIYLIGTYFVTGSGTTWEELAPPGTDWYDFAYSDPLSRWRTWNEILGADPAAAASRLIISALYSENQTGPYDKEVSRLEILTGIIKGRWVKLRFEINDINNASYLTLEEHKLYSAYLENALLVSA